MPTPNGAVEFRNSRLSLKPTALQSFRDRGTLVHQTLVHQCENRVQSIPPADPHLSSPTTMTLRPFIVLFLATASFTVTVADNLPERPNILWLTSEDNGPQLGCYGDEYADTPNLDALATKSLRYQMCWSNAPVCAPARTTLISGMYATSLGGHHMRSAVSLPAGMKLYPTVLGEAGYYCTNNSKTDYNFSQTDKIAGWADSGRKAHWRNRPDPSQPFFSVFNYTISHESKIRNEPHTLVHDPAKAKLPAYHPDVPEVRRDWAQYYDRLTEMDAEAGRTLKQLEKDGLADSTIVFYYGDHGSGMPRSKRWPFNSGLQVPFLLHVPDGYKHLAPEDYLPGGVTERLVSFVDMGPTAISLAGASVPETMQGIPFCGSSEGTAKKYLFGFRGRMDERIDMVRSCTDGRFVYMRHFYPDRPYLKHVDYMFQTKTTQVWKQMFDDGELNDVQAKFWQAKPVEELFDLQSDPDEVNNLAMDPDHADKLSELQAATKQWMIDTRDMGVLPEGEMHRRVGTRSPRAVALSDNFRINEIVDAAWAAGDAWGVYHNGVTQSMSGLAKSKDSGIRFWAVRGVHLGLQSHASVIESETIDASIAILASRLDDPSPSVRVIAAEGLLEFGVESQKVAAATELVKLATVPDNTYYVAVAAFNVIDENYDAVMKYSGASPADLLKDTGEGPTLGKNYVERLLKTISETH